MGAEEQILLDKISKSVGDYSTYIEYNASNNPVYIGDAKHGTATSTAEWRIKKITYDVSGNPTSVLWAEGTTTFSMVWADRASYTYS